MGNCKTCEGYGTVDDACVECSGSGVVEVECDDCGGTGKTEETNGAAGSNVPANT